MNPDNECTCRTCNTLRGEWTRKEAIRSAIENAKEIVRANAPKGLAKERAIIDLDCALNEALGA